MKERDSIHDDIARVIGLVGGCFWAVIGLFVIGIGVTGLLQPILGPFASVIGGALAVMNGYLSLMVAARSARIDE